MGEKKYDFFEPSSMFKFEFAGPSLIWGAGIGGLIGLHKFRNSSNINIGKIRESIIHGLFFGFITGFGIWGYYMYEFTMTNYIIRKQSHIKREVNAIDRYVDEITKKHYGHLKYSDEELQERLDTQKTLWKKLEEELTEDPKVN